MERVIITGADGFLGSHLTRYLSLNNYEVYALVLNNSNRKEILSEYSNVHVVEFDLNQYEAIIDIIPQNAFAFFHFAWVGVSPEFRNDFETQMRNVQLSINAVKLAASVKAQKFIFPGSTLEYAYYGKPIDSNAIPSPLNAYGVAKISARYASSILCENLDISYIYTVISSIYSEDRKDNNVIYYTIDKLLRGERPSLTKLEQLWDYIHIDDVVLGLKLISEKGKSNSFYALGHGDNCPLSDYIYLIRDLINPKIELGIGDIPYQNSQIPSSCVNLYLLTRDTGFLPQISFNKGIINVINKVKKSCSLHN